MKHMLDIIIDYLQNDNRETALMINGKWGSGKTYYAKNTLIPKLKIKKYKCLYVSLNGVNIIDEISDRIILSLFGASKKASWGVIKSLYRFSTEANLGSNIGVIQDFVKSVSKVTEKTTLNKKLKDTLLIIDDLERISTDIKIEDVLGYICSNYLEASKTKIIFVCNDEEIPNTEKFAVIKEKSISKSIKFTPDLPLVLDSFIHNPNYINNVLFQNFYSSNKPLIIDILQKAKIINLRTIQSIFDVFNRVSLIITNKPENLYLVQVFRFIVSIQNEYALGTLPMDNKDVLDKMRVAPFTHIIMRDRRKKDENDNSDYFDSFLVKYNEGMDEGWVFFESIYNYITMYYFDSDLFLKELADQIIVPSPELDAINAFHNIYYQDSEDKVQEIFKNLIPYIEKGFYNIRDLYSIYNNIRYVRESEIDLENVNKIETLVLDKCKTIIQSQTNPRELSKLYHDLSMFELNEEFKNIIDPIYHEAMRKAEMKNITTKSKRFFELLELDSGDYMEMKEMLLTGLIFKEIVDSGLINNFTTLKSHAIMILRSAINMSIMQISNAGEVHYQELPHLQKIVDEIEKNLSSDKWKKNIQTMLVMSLKSAIEHINKTNPNK